jgi:flavorubredoxin
LVFGDYGWSGEATQLIQNYLKSIKINVFDEIIKVKFSISSEDKKHIEETTKKFINLI